MLLHWEYSSKQNRSIFAFLKLTLLWVRQAIRRQLYSGICSRKERVMQVGYFRKGSQEGQLSAEGSEGKGSAMRQMDSEEAQVLQAE